MRFGAIIQKECFPATRQRGRANKILFEISNCRPQMAGLDPTLGQDWTQHWGRNGSNIGTRLVPTLGQDWFQHWDMTGFNIRTGLVPILGQDSSQNLKVKKKKIPNTKIHFITLTIFETTLFFTIFGWQKRLKIVNTINSN